MARARRPGPLARWRARARDERRALAEAFAMLALASVIVKLSRFRLIARLAARPVTAPAPADPAHTVATVAWAVRAAARRARFRAVCIEQGIAAQAMLRRRGIAATLHYGIASESAGLSAHVWVRCDDRDVVGCEEAPRFRLLASFTGEVRRAPQVN